MDFFHDIKYSKRRILWQFRKILALTKILGRKIIMSRQITLRALRKTLIEEETKERKGKKKNTKMETPHSNNLKL